MQDEVARVSTITMANNQANRRAFLMHTINSMFYMCTKDRKEMAGLPIS